MQKKVWKQKRSWVGMFSLGVLLGVLLMGLWKRPIPTTPTTLSGALAQEGAAAVAAADRGEDTLFFSSRRYARQLKYLEEFYRLYYLPQQYVNDDLHRNLYWLRHALSAPFAPPIQALAVPKSEAEYERYQLLMKMHLHYLIIKNTIFLAARFDKHQPVFFNLPYRKEILESLALAKLLYESALTDWEAVLSYYEAVDGDETREWRLERSGLTFLEDTVERLREGELDYGRVIARKLAQLEEKKAYFEAE